MAIIIWLIFLLILAWAFIYLLKSRRKDIKNGYVVTRFGTYYKSKSPKMFLFSIWIDVILVGTMILGLIIAIFLELKGFSINQLNG